jgi:hypothetical protein
MGYTPQKWALDNVHGQEARYIAAVTSRQAGKSFCAAIEVDDAMSQPENEFGLPVVGLIAPTYSHCDIVVDRYLEFLTKAFGRESFKYNQNKHLVTIEDPAAGTVGARFQWLSADDPLFAMGRTYSRLLFDEGQRVSDAVFQKARPTVSVRDGDIRAFGTPDINPEQSWFKGLWLRGQDDDPEYHSFSLPWTENKFMSAKDIKEAKDQSTDREFRMLYLGEWVDDEGSFFTDFERSLLPTTDVYESGHKYAMGVDFAAMEDYNAVVVADLSTRTCVYRKRWNKTDPLLTYEEIERIWHDWGKPTAFCDETGLGGIAMMSELKERGIRCVPIKFGANQYSNQKMEIYSRLAADLEHRRLMFPSEWEDVIRELKGFVYQRTPSGRVTAAAAAGYHDDLVAALALVNEGLRMRSRTTGNTTRSYIQSENRVGGGDKLRELLRSL